MVAYAIQDVLGIEVPDYHCSLSVRAHLLTCRQKCASFRDSDLTDAAFVTFQVGMLLLADTLDNDGAANRPNEVHVRWMNHHAILVGGVKAN